MIKTLLLAFVYFSFAQDFNLAFDHFNIAVPDLKSAELEFSALGFLIIPGRIHTNSIENKFIKFSDETEIELITATKKMDNLSAWYCNFISENQTAAPAFIAFHTTDIEAIGKKLNLLKLKFQLTGSKHMKTISFDPGSLYHPIFFISYSNRREVDNLAYIHKNTASGIQSIWLNSNLKRLFINLGFKNFKKIVHNSLGDVDELEFAGKSILFADSPSPIIGVTFKVSLKKSKEILFTHGLYMEFISE